MDQITQIFIYKCTVFILIFQIDVESTEFRQPRRNRKRDLFKRVMSSSHYRSNTSEADSQGNSPVKSTVSEHYIHVTDKCMNIEQVNDKTFYHFSLYTIQTHIK